MHALNEFEFTSRWITNPENKRGQWKNSKRCNTGQYFQKASLQLLPYGIFGVQNLVIGINMECSNYQITTQSTMNSISVSGISRNNPLYSTNWRECEPGRFICGIRSKINVQSHITGVEFKCCTFI